LSPAINDPGTAIDIIGRGVRLLTLWRDAPAPESLKDFKYPRLWLPPLSADEMFNDLFASIGRDGAALIEVQVRLQKALLALAELGEAGYRQSALRVSRTALERAEAAIEVVAEKEEMRAAAARIAALA
jgi:uncharacterized membrane protein